MFCRSGFNRELSRGMHEARNDCDEFQAAMVVSTPQGWTSEVKNRSGSLDASWARHCRRPRLKPLLQKTGSRNRSFVAQALQHGGAVFDELLHIVRSGFRRQYRQRLMATAIWCFVQQLQQSIYQR